MTTVATTAAPAPIPIHSQEPPEEWLGDDGKLQSGSPPRGRAFGVRPPSLRAR